jgi:myo-inositol-hexaphosphate 3-phosphohydrolase
VGNERVSLVVYGTRDGRLGVYAVDPISRSLFDVAGGAIRPSIRSRGICLYHSLVSDSYYAFVTDGAGTMEQWKLSDDGTGRVTGVRVRSLEGVGRSEGCVADDTHGLLYAAENGLGIWRIAAEPWNGASPTLLDASGSAERRAVDFDDLTIYEAAIGTGYLIASRAGRDSFVVYERRGANVYVASFEVDALARPESEPGASAAAAGQRLGIDVVGLPLGAAFPEGLFVARDAANPEGHRTFNLVPWGSIARALTPNLRIDTSFDPRRFGRAIRANRPPSVRAGPDARVALGGSVSLAGAVSDDGLPRACGCLATAWSQVAGPGTATFSAPDAAVTSVGFSLPGLYTLRLTADDGDLSEIDDLLVEVIDPSRPGPDALYEAGGQAVAYRFAGLGIPRNATILSAYLEFEAGMRKPRTNGLTIRGQAADNAPTLAWAARDSILGSLTRAAVDWSPPAGAASHRGAVARRTPNLAPVIQEIVSRPGWSPGSAVVLVITGTGTSAEASFDGGGAEAPQFHIEYRRRPG